jgi:diketogulonate reductase-like aldo/keto reductase
VIKESQSLLDYCAKKGILIEAYGPSVPVTKAAGGPVDAVLDDIAKDLGKKSGQSVTPGQVLLKVRGTWKHCRS